jgi:L-arabinokinase
MHILYYITSHGYGHGVRSCCIANALPKDIQITFRTTLPKQFFHEELQRPFSYSSGEFDCGCIQSDGVTTDIDSTLQRYKNITQQNKQLLSDEIRWCQEHHIDGVISDITPFAFEVAHNLGVPSIAISNFTWFDIYNEYIPGHEFFLPFLDQMQMQYSLANTAIALYPSLPMNYFKNIIKVPIIGRRGKDIREKILEKYNISAQKKIGLIYVGNFGMQTARWELLERYDNWEFLSVYPLHNNPSNFHLITKDDFPYQDLIASSDVMIAKLGYGSVSECMLNGKPIIYLPRTFFAEFKILETSVTQWGGGIKLSTEEFYNLQWNNALEKAASMILEPVVSDGVEKTVKVIESTFSKETTLR